MRGVSYIWSSERSWSSTRGYGYGRRSFLSFAVLLPLGFLVTFLRVLLLLLGYEWIMTAPPLIFLSWFYYASASSAWLESALEKDDLLSIKSTCSIRFFFEPSMFCFGIPTYSGGACKFVLEFAISEILSDPILLVLFPYICWGFSYLIGLVYISVCLALPELVCDASVMLARELSTLAKTWLT